MSNYARFKINGTASTTGGYDAATGAAITLQLEASPGVLAQRVVYSTYDAADVNSPLASMSAPGLTLDNGAGSTGASVQAATPTSAVTTTMPASGVHSYIVRCTINGGVSLDGVAEPDYVFERMLSIRSSSGRRKIVGTEGTQYSPRGWADAQNEDVEAAILVGDGVGFSTVLYVDTAGDDATGTRGVLTLPYATVAAALADAQVGDLVLIGPGTFDEDGLSVGISGLTIRGSGMEATEIGMGHDNEPIFVLGAAVTSLTIEDLAAHSNVVAPVDLDGTAYANPGVFETGLVIRRVKTISEASSLCMVTCAQKVVVEECELNGLWLREVREAKVLGTRFWDDGLDVRYDEAETETTTGANNAAEILGCSFVAANGITITKNAVVVVSGGTPHHVTITATEGTDDGNVRITGCDLDAGLVVSGEAVADQTVAVASGCRMASVTATRSAGANRCKVDVRGCAVSGTVTANDGCDIDIQGGAFGSIISAGDGTVDRTVDGGPIALIVGDTDVVFTVPFSSPDYVITIEPKAVGTDVIIPAAQKTATGFRATSAAIDAGARWGLIRTIFQIV